RVPGRSIVMPVEVLTREDAFWHRGGIVEHRRNRLGAGGRKVVATRRTEIPGAQLRDRRRERIQKQLVDIKTMPFPWAVGTVHPVGVELSRPDATHPDMPDIARAVVSGIQIDDLDGDRIRGTLEQLQPNSSGVTAEERKVDSSLHFSGPEWQRSAPSHFSAFIDLL